MCLVYGVTRVVRADIAPGVVPFAENGHICSRLAMWAIPTLAEPGCLNILLVSCCSIACFAAVSFAQQASWWKS
jgi:hypothetical protein